MSSLYEFTPQERKEILKEWEKYDAEAKVKAEAEAQRIKKQEEELWNTYLHSKEEYDVNEEDKPRGKRREKSGCSKRKATEKLFIATQALDKLLKKGDVSDRDKIKKARRRAKNLVSKAKN